MKKGIIISICIILVVGIVLINSIFKKEEKTESTKITLAEVTHSIFYAPLYVAIENGYFEDEGIDLELVLTSGADKVASAVLSGTEIGLAGAESAIYVYGQTEDYLQIFSGLTKKDGQFIVARDGEDFSLEDLYGSEILVGRSTGMPALSFLNAMRNAGVDTNKININYSIDFANLSTSFISGIGDYVNLFEPNATVLEEEGYGTVVASVGELSGEVPYTVFYATKSFIEENPDIIEGFTNAIAKGLQFVMDNDAETIALVVSGQFPDTSIEDLSIMIDRYKEYDCWLATPYIDEELLTNLEEFLMYYNLIDEFVEYDEIINNFYER